MERLHVELHSERGTNLRLYLEIKGAAGNTGYPEDVIKTVKADDRYLKRDETSLTFEDKKFP